MKRVESHAVQIVRRTRKRAFAYMVMVLVVLLNFDNFQLGSTVFGSNADLSTTEAVWVCVKSLDKQMFEWCLEFFSPQPRFS